MPVSGPVTHVTDPKNAEDLIRIEDPSTGESIGEIAGSSVDSLHDAITAAEHAQRSWRRTPAAERGAALHEVARRLRADAESLATLNARETGKLIGDARGGIAAAASTIEQYAELGPVHRGRSLHGRWEAADLMVHEPYGVVAVITPWNDPVAVPAGLLAAALVTGNTVVFKPSERCPHVGRALADVFADVLPDGVLQLVQGDGRVGGALSAHPGVRAVAHVGSTAAGRAIKAAAIATDAKVLLENGGKDPLIVDAGVDPEWAAAQATIGAFVNAGQLCTAVERIYVVRDVADAFVEALVDRAKALRQGPALDGSTELGPLVDRRQRQVVHQQVSGAVEAGAKILVGGEIPDGPGAFYPATVLLDEQVDSPLWREETFGPVAPVHVVDDFDTAIALANAGRYGLAATVLTPSLVHAQQAWRDLDAGTVKINAVFGGAPGGAAQPRRASGQGFGYGPELLDELTQVKVVHLTAAAY